MNEPSLSPTLRFPQFSSHVFFCSRLPHTFKLLLAVTVCQTFLVWDDLDNLEEYWWGILWNSFGCELSTVQIYRTMHELGKSCSTRNAGLYTLIPHFCATFRAWTNFKILSRLVNAAARRAFLCLFYIWGNWDSITVTVRPRRTHGRELKPWDSDCRSSSFSAYWLHHKLPFAESCPNLKLFKDIQSQCPFLCCFSSEQ